MAIVIPFSFAGIILKQVINYGPLSEWKVQVERVMAVLFLLALPLTFHEVAVHFLGIDPLPSPDLYSFDTDGSEGLQGNSSAARMSFEGLYAGLLFLEYAVSYFGSALWQRSTDRRRNPKDTAIDVEIGPLKRKVLRLKKALTQNRSRQVVVENNLNRDQATTKAIQSILKKTKP